VPGHSDRDNYRHPLETLEFFGFKPSLTTLEVDPGDGWYTELLAPALSAKGRLIVTTADPNGPADQRSTRLYHRRMISNRTPGTLARQRRDLTGSNSL